jgi:hypothetical protein
MKPPANSLLDPSITPHTWKLNENVKAYLRTLETGEDQKNQKDLVCSPSHALIVTLSESLFEVGSPGFDLHKIFENPVEDPFYGVMSRGLTSPNIFASLLPSIGMYIFHLWLIRCFIQLGSDKWRLGKVLFSLNFGDNSTQNYPDLDCHAIRLEWLWINEFLYLSKVLCEPNLDLIPAYWTGDAGADTKNEPQWKKKHL